MSGIIAVSVSLIGLTGVLFTLGILVQMILSFPAMLSSNSQAYVHQQRKTYTLGAKEEAQPLHITVGVEAEWEYELEEEQFDISVEKWIDSVVEATNGLDSEAESVKAAQRRINMGARQPEHVTRGRPLRRKRRTVVTRQGLRPNQTSGVDHPSDDHEYDADAGAHQPTDDRHLCSPGWRESIKWTR